MIKKILMKKNHPAISNVLSAKRWHVCRAISSTVLVFNCKIKLKIIHRTISTGLKTRKTQAKAFQT